MSDETIVSKTQGQLTRGRPTGSRNKPKLDTQQLNELKDKVGRFLPQADWNYLAGVLEGTDKPILEKDLDIFLTLQLKALLPQLAQEIEGGQLTKEATQRSSTIKELLALRFQMEKHEKGEDTPNAVTFIQNVFQARGIDQSRLAALTGGVGSPIEGVARPLPRTADADEGRADEVGAIPSQLPERSE
jgi:hypothetical protein